MIKVYGQATLKARYAVKLNLTKEQFDGLSERTQDELIDQFVDWADACRSAEIDEIDVDDIFEEDSE